MRKLVKNRDDSSFTNGIRNLRAENVGLGKGDGAGVLHCSSVELWNEQLVILVERVWVVECLFEELEALTGLLEDVVSVQKLGHRSTCKYTERDDATIAAGQLAANLAIWPGYQCGDVARNDRGRLERPGGLAVSD